MDVPIRIEGEATTPAELLAWCRALAQLNAALLQSRPLPPLYESGIVYRPEHRAERAPEQWLTAHRVFAQGHGDCEDLATWRVAELLLNGTPAEPALQQQTTRDAVMWHVVVALADGDIEDPSETLGMHHGSTVGTGTAAARRR